MDTADHSGDCKDTFPKLSSFNMHNVALAAVTMEMVKICQSMVFIAADRTMYHAETDTPALARTR
jgi:hypothetical protein